MRQYVAVPETAVSIITSRKTRSVVLSTSNTSLPSNTAEKLSLEIWRLLACWYCNLKKGPNLAGINLESGETVPLFNPRKDEWADHFDLSLSSVAGPGIEIKGRTSTGRATLRVPQMNDEMRRVSAV